MSVKSPQIEPRGLPLIMPPTQEEQPNSLVQPLPGGLPYSAFPPPDEDGGESGLLALQSAIPLPTDQPGHEQAQSLAGKTFGFVKSSVNWFGSGGAWVAGKVAGGTSWVAAKALEYGCFRHADIQKIQAKSSEELREMTQGSLLGDLLSRASFGIAEIVRTKAFKPGILKSIIDSEGDFLHHLIESLLTRVAVNVGKDLQRTRGEGPVTPAELVLHLSGILKKHLAALQENLKEVDAIEDPEMRAAARDKVLKKSLDNILLILLPKGAEELPLRSGVQGIVWSYLKTTILPPLLLEVATITGNIQSVSKLDELKNDPKTEVLANIVGSSNYLMQREVEQLADPKVAESLADTILKKFPGQDVGPSDELKVWITQQIQQFSKVAEPPANTIWPLVTGGVEVLLSHVLFNLSSSRQPGEDAIAAIIQKFGATAVGFVESMGPEIALAPKEWSVPDNNGKLDPRYTALFKPLADTLIHTCGLEAEKLPIPGIAIVLNEFEQQLPTLLAKNYKNIIEPVAEFYSDVMNPEDTDACEELKSLPGGEFIGTKGNDVKRLVATKVPEFLAEKHEEVSTTIFLKVASLVPKLDAQVQESIVGKTAEEAEKGWLKEGEDLEKQIAVVDAFSWLHPWLDKNIEAIGKSNDPRLLNIWKFLESTTDEVFAHGIRAIYKKKSYDGTIKVGDKRDISVEAINEILGVFGKYMETHGTEVHARYRELRKQGVEPKEDKEFVAMLHPLCDDLYELLGLSDAVHLPIPNLFKPGLKPLVIDLMSSWMADEYRQSLSPEECNVECRSELLNIISPVSKEKADIEVEQIDRLCGLLSAKITDSLEDIAQNQLKQQVGSKVAGLELPAIRQFKDSYVKDVIKSVLLQMTVNYLKGLQADGKPYEGGTISGILVRMGTVLNNHLAQDAAKIKEAESIADPVKRKAKLAEALGPLSKDLLELFRSPSAYDTEVMPVAIPLPTILGPVWDPLKNEIVPDFLAGLYEDKISWPGLLEANRAEILKRTESSHIPEACRVLATWVSEFLPPFLYRERVDLSSTLFKAAATFLAESGNPDGLSVEQYLKENENEIKQRLAQDVFSFFAPDGPLIEHGKPLTKEYVEFIMVKLFNGISKRVDEKEKAQEDYLLREAINLLTVADKHFKTLNRAAGSKPAYEHKHEHYIRAFKAKVNTVDGVLQDEKSIQANKDFRDAMKVIDAQLKIYDSLENDQEREYCMEIVKIEYGRMKEARKTEDRLRKEFFSKKDNPMKGFAQSKEAIDAAKEIDGEIKAMGKKLDNYRKFSDAGEKTRCKGGIQRVMEKIGAAKKKEDVERKAFFEERATLEEGVPGSDAALKADKDIREAMAVLNAERKRYPKLSAGEQKKCMNTIKAAQKKLRAAKEVEEAERRKFFEPLTNALLEIGGISKPEDFPFPEPLRSQVFDLAKTQLVPNALSSVFSIMLEPSTLNNIMSTAFEQLNLALDAAPDPNAVETEVPKDETQRLLNKVCGELVLELLQQVPESYTRVALKFDTVKKFTTEAVGEAVRKQLGENLTLSQIIEKGIASGIPSFHPGDWQEVEGKMVFVGKPKEGEAGTLKFTFAMTDDEIEAEERKKMLENQKAEKKMKKLMVSTIHRLLSDTIADKLKAPFLWFLNLWNSLVDKIFGKYAPSVRDFFKYDGNKLVFRILETIFVFLYKTVTFIPWFIMDLHNASKVDRVIEGLHMKIHENLLVGLTNELIAALRREGTIDQANIFRPIVEAAEERDRISEEKRQAYLEKWGLASPAEPEVHPEEGEEMEST